MPRPKSNKPVPTASERVKKSIDALMARGGKRLMLRLSPEAYNALKIIMAMEEIKTETSAINCTLIERERQLLRKPTKQASQKKK